MGRFLNFLIKAKYKKFYTSFFEQCTNHSLKENQSTKHDDDFYNDDELEFNESSEDQDYFIEDDKWDDNYSHDQESLEKRFLDKQFYQSKPFQVEENGKIYFEKNNKIDWIARIYYDQKYLDYVHSPLGSFEISINVFGNKIALYACECKTKFLFIYATELKTKATIFNILVAFNIFFTFIKKNNLPLLDIYLERNDTYLAFDLLSNLDFRDLLNRHLDFENLFVIKSNDFISLKKHQIHSLNVLLIQDMWSISNYWNIFNNSKFEYKDTNNTTVIYTSPINYIRKLLKENNAINQW